MSCVTASTLGGVDFDQLCRGDIQSYSFNPVDLTGERDVKQIEQKLIQRLEDTVRDLELQSDRRIAKYYIGKTYVKRRRKRGGGYQVLNSFNHHTWMKKGISSRWSDHRKEDYGRDGLVVLGILTRQSLPMGCPKQIHQEDLALAMEQKLLHHFLLSELDSRVANDTFTAGRLDDGNSFAYAVYMAFSYEDTNTSTDTEQEEISPQQQLNPTRSQSSNLDQESHQSATVSPNPKLYRRLSSDCIITAQFSGTQSDLRSRRRPATLTDTEQEEISPQQQLNPTHSQSSNLDQEGHQSADNMTPVSPNPKLYKRLSSDCIITAQFSGTQGDPRSRRRPANPPTSTHQPHPHQQVANTPSHTSPPPPPPPLPVPMSTKKKQPCNTNNPIMERFLNSLTANRPT